MKQQKYKYSYNWMKILVNNLHINKHLDDDGYKCLMKELLETIPSKQEDKEEWNENVEDCSGCGIHWKKVGKQCPVCFAPPEKRKSSPLDNYEEIEEVDLILTSNMWHGKIINKLIRNQKKDHKLLVNILEKK